MSPYPGNINLLVIGLESYLPTLQPTKVASGMRVMGVVGRGAWVRVWVERHPSPVPIEPDGAVRTAVRLVPGPGRAPVNGRPGPELSIANAPLPSTGGVGGGIRRGEIQWE